MHGLALCTCMLYMLCMHLYGNPHRNIAFLNKRKSHYCCCLMSDNMYTQITKTLDKIKLNKSQTMKTYLELSKCNAKVQTGLLITKRKQVSLYITTYKTFLSLCGSSFKQQSYENLHLEKSISGCCFINLDNKK